MKRFFSFIVGIVFLLMVVGFVNSASAYTIRLAWDYTNSTGEDAATGFKLYVSDTGVGGWVQTGSNIDVSITQADYSFTPTSGDTRKYFAVSAFNTYGESEKAGPVSFVFSAGGGGWTGPAKPGGLSVVDCNIDSENPICTGQ